MIGLREKRSDWWWRGEGQQSILFSRISSCFVTLANSAQQLFISDVVQWKKLFDDKYSKMSDFYAEKYNNLLHFHHKFMINVIQRKKMLIICYIVGMRPSEPT